MTATLNEVVQFLLGAGQLENCYFGEKPKPGDGNFWWRPALRAAFDSYQDTSYLKLRSIRKVVAEYYHVTEDGLKSSSRSPTLNCARQMGMYICRELTEYSTTDVGAAFGRDHTTVVKSYPEMKRRLKKDADLRKQYQELKTLLAKREEP